MKNIVGFILATILVSGCIKNTVSDTDIPAILTETPYSYTSFALPTFEAIFKGVRVTFISNEGILITVDDKKILIDALFRVGMPAGLPEIVANATLPCDEVDLILVTHDHLDHFDAGLVRQYLQANPKTRIASTSQVTAKLSDLKEQVITLNARQGKTDQVIVNEIQVKAYFLSHDKEAGDVINYGYLITINDILFFHAGDFNDSAGALSVLKTYQLDQEGIDIAFVPYWLLPLFTIDADNDRIGSKYIFPIHYQFYDVQFIKELYHPQAIFFDYNLQSWIMPEEE